MARKFDGTLVIWGDNWWGQLDPPPEVFGKGVLFPTGGLRPCVGIAFDTMNDDTDGDGVPDGWELLAGGQPLVAAIHWPDQDGDGFDDREEYLADTNPRDAGSHLVALVSAQTPQGLSVADPSPDRRYRLWSTTNLAAQPQVWMPVGPAQAGNGGLLELDDPEASTSAVYRVSVGLP